MDTQVQEDLNAIELDQAPEHEQSSLPPVDGGRQAWLLLVASFVIEMLLWGFPYAFGIMQTYYSSHAPISEQPNGLSAVGTTCSGMLYLTAPFMTAIIQQSNFFRTYSTWTGLTLCVLAIVLSSFSTRVWHLVLTQGVLYGLGGGFLYYPLFLYIDEWFIRRKLFAYGVAWAGTSIGGLSMPLILEWGVNRFGAERFLRGWAVTLALCVGPLLFFVKPRVPWSSAKQGGRRSLTAGFGFLKIKSFWIFQATIAIQGMGVFIPSLYLPTYAQTLGLSTLQSSAMVSILNLAGAPGSILFSLICDKISIATSISITSFGSAIAIFLLWGLSSSATSLPLLVMFALLYGFCTGGFTVLFSKIAKEVHRMAPEGSVDMVNLMGVEMAVRGIGSVACGPVSQALLQGRTKTYSGFAYGSYYSPLVVFAGTTAVLAMFLPWTTRLFRL